MTTIACAIASYQKQLTIVSDTPRLDIEILLMEVMLLTRAQLIIHSEKQLTSAEERQLECYVQRRLQQEPIAYIVGHQDFWTLDLEVTKDTLIPRPETEHLVEWILERFPQQQPIKMADLGVGSGAIALALASERPLWKIDATDKSSAALTVAKRNANRHGIRHVDFFLGDWCTALPASDYNLIVSNPPYIAPEDPHLENLSFEPISALVAADEGGDALKIIIEQSKKYLIANAYLVLEHGASQAKVVQTWLQEAGFSQVESHQDYAGLPRFVTAVWSLE